MVKTLTIFGVVFLAVVAGGITCLWLLAKGCEESAHKTFNNVTETLKFSTPTPVRTASNSISND
jgi:hypothetical protein